MIEVKKGDILQSGAQTLVNTVNCVGVMGKGIALAFKEQFPEMYKDYAKRCDSNEVKLGKPYIYKSLALPWVILFPTKDHWRSVSRVEDIIKGLEYIYKHYREWDVTSLAVPPLGCGEGGLEWRVIGRTLYRYLKKLDIQIELYAPYGTPVNELTAEYLSSPVHGEPGGYSGFSQERINPAWFVLVETVGRINGLTFGRPVGRTAFQKIAYVATREGLPTGLSFSKCSFGPFSRKVKPILTKLINNGLLEEERYSNFFALKTGPTFSDAEGVYKRVVSEWDDTIQKLVDLFVRVDTRQSEIMATVLFANDSLVERNKRRPNESELLKEIMDWKRRRKPSFEEKDIAYTIRNLAALKWIDVEPSPGLPLNL